MNSTPLAQQAKLLNDDSFIVFFSVTNLAAFYHVKPSIMQYAFSAMENAQEVFVALSDVPQLTERHGKAFLPEMVSSPFRFSSKDVKIDLSGNNVSIKVSTKFRKQGFADHYVRGINQGEFYFLPRLCEWDDEPLYLSPFIEGTSSPYDDSLTLIAFDLCYVERSDKTETPLVLAEDIPVKESPTLRAESRFPSARHDAEIHFLLDDVSRLDLLKSIVKHGPMRMEGASNFHWKYDDIPGVEFDTYRSLCQHGLIDKIIVEGKIGYWAATHFGNQVLTYATIDKIIS